MSVQTVSVTALRRKIEDGSLGGLIDVRTAAEYHRLHARGAYSAPMQQLNPAKLSAFRSHPDEPLYLICQSGARSNLTCERLASAGVLNLFSIEGGTAAWEAAGLPTVRGVGGAISLERQVRIAAGALVAIGVALGCVISRTFLALPALVGLGLVFAGITDYCGMGLLLARMPWNTRDASRAGEQPALPVRRTDVAADGARVEARLGSGA